MADKAAFELRRAQAEIQKPGLKAKIDALVDEHDRQLSCSTEGCSDEERSLAIRKDFVAKVWPRVEGDYKEMLALLLPLVEERLEASRLRGKVTGRVKSDREGSITNTLARRESEFNLLYTSFRDVFHEMHDLVGIRIVLQSQDDLAKGVEFIEAEFGQLKDPAHISANRDVGNFWNVRFGAYESRNHRVGLKSGSTVDRATADAQDALSCYEGVMFEVQLTYWSKMVYNIIAHPALYKGRFGDLSKQTEQLLDVLGGTFTSLDVKLELLSDALRASAEQRAISAQRGTPAQKQKLEETKEAILRELAKYGSDVRSNVEEFIEKQMQDLAAEKPSDPRVSGLLERIDNEERRKILDWISAIPYLKHQITVREARTSGTCNWLLQHEKFREWEDPNSSAILWLQGSPGAGKTYLTSKVIDHLKSLRKNSPDNEGFAFFYCNRNEEERRKPLSVLRSYIRQLSANPGNIRKSLRNLYHKAAEIGFETCKEQLVESVNLYHKTTLVLDALDECEANSRRRIVEVMENLLSRSKRPLKIFISSRPDGDIRAHFSSWPTVEIHATDNQTDIEKFVHEEIVRHPRWEKMRKSLKQKIVKTLLDQSSGMFQWAFLQTQQLLELETAKAIRDRLGKLPQDLKVAYDEIYGKIAARHKHDKDLADRAFMWVMCACRPLRTTELITAIRLDHRNDALHIDDAVDGDLLLRLCNNLLVLDSQRNVWRFSHLSVTEYFESNHWGLWQAHSHAAKVCLKLLIETYNPIGGSKVIRADEDSDEDSDEGSDEGSDENQPTIFDQAHPFQIYSRHHWMVHVRSYEEAQVEEEAFILSSLLKTFLGSPEKSSAHYRGWHRQIVFEAEAPLRDPGAGAPLVLSPALDYRTPREFSSEVIATFAMCRFSFHSLLRDWWESAEINLSQTNGYGENLLGLAAVAGCKPICGHLIKRGIPVNMALQSKRYGSALVAAVGRGGFEIVQFLIEQGADVNMALDSGFFGSALAAAAEVGEIDIVKFLVERGADVNMALDSGECGSALAAAAARGQIDIVKFLVERGADVNMALDSGEFGSALAAAAAGEEIDIVKFLVERGADVSMVLQTESYSDADAAEAARSNPEIVKFLIEKGAVTAGITEMF